MKNLPKKNIFKMPAIRLILFFGIFMLILLALNFNSFLSQLIFEKPTTEQSSTINEDNSKPTNTSTSVNGELKVHFINVGEADSILVQQGASTMLIDGGTDSDGQSVKSYIDNQGINKLDYVVGTHAHDDNIGGLDYIISEFQVNKVYFPVESVSSKTFKNFEDAIKSKNLTFTLPTVNESFKLGDATCTILAPNSSNYNNQNDYSIVLKVQFGDTSFLFTGDAKIDSETEMLAKGLNLKADVLKLAHHGSKTSTSDNFLSSVNPKYAVISVGKDNNYGHPGESTMNKLKSANVQVYRTDENGTIVAKSNGKDIEFNTSPGSYNGKTFKEDSED